MRVLIDTNIIIDYLAHRDGLWETSARVGKLCETGQIDGYISALSIANIIYILRKSLNKDKTKEMLTKLMNCYMVTDLKASDLSKAMNLDFDDYEDALQTVSALNIEADYIITRNVTDFINSPIPVLLPEDLII